MCDGIGSFWWTTDRLGMVPLPISLIDLTRAPIETRQPWMSRQFDCSAFGQIGMAFAVAHFDCTTRSFVSIDTHKFTPMSIGPFFPSYLTVLSKMVRPSCYCEASNGAPAQKLMFVVGLGGCVRIV